MLRVARCLPNVCVLQRLLFHGLSLAGSQKCAWAAPRVCAPFASALSWGRAARCSPVPTRPLLPRLQYAYMGRPQSFWDWFFRDFGKPGATSEGAGAGGPVGRYLSLAGLRVPLQRANAACSACCPGRVPPCWP